MDLNALEAELRKGDVSAVVATLGTTAMGAVDPLDGILALKKRYGFRVHVDAAYGGYFRLISRGARRAGAAGLRGHRRGRLDCGRSAQARPAALRLRLRALPRPGGGALLQARFALYLLHFKAVAPGRDQPGVLPRRGRGGGACGPRSSFCRSCRAASLPRGLARGRAAALELDRRLRGGRSLPAALAGGLRSWILWCGR